MSLSKLVYEDLLCYGDGFYQCDICEHARELQCDTCELCDTCCYRDDHEFKDSNVIEIRR